MSVINSARLLVLFGVLAWSAVPEQSQPAAPTKPVSSTTGFPEPDAVIKGFYVNSQQFAALQVIETVIREKGRPQSSGLNALLSRYRSAMTELRNRNSTRREFQPDVQEFLRSRSFRTDVLHRYLPQYENASIAPFEKDSRYNPAPVKHANTNLMVAGTALLMLAVPMIYLILGERAGAKAGIPHDPNYAFCLPASLAGIKVLRLHLQLDFDCGRIYDQQVRTQTYTTKYLKREQYGMSGPQSPGNFDTTFSSITYYKYLLKTPDGREIGREFTGDTFLAAVGDITSFISCDDRILYIFNHTRQQFVTLHAGVGQMLRFRAGRGLWLTTIGVAIAGGAAIMSVEADNETAWRAFWAVPIVLGFFSGIYIIILKILVQLARRIPFRVLWRPQLRKFMESQTTQLEQFYSRQASVPGE